MRLTPQRCWSCKYDVNKKILFCQKAMVKWVLASFIVVCVGHQSTEIETIALNPPVVFACRSVGNSSVSLSRCSCCEVRSSSSWTSSSPTPRAANLCPSYSFSSHMDLCLGPLSTEGQGQAGGELSKETFSYTRISPRDLDCVSIYPSVGWPWSDAGPIFSAAFLSSK